MIEEFTAAVCLTVIVLTSVFLALYVTEKPIVVEQAVYEQEIIQAPRDGPPIVFAENINNSKGDVTQDTVTVETVSMGSEPGLEAENEEAAPKRSLKQKRKKSLRWKRIVTMRGSTRSLKSPKKKTKWLWRHTKSDELKAA